MKQLIAALGLALAFALTAAPAFAQGEATEVGDEEPSPEDRETSFQNVTGPQVEDVPGGALLIGAYGVAWLLVVAYLWRLAALSRLTSGEIDALHHALRNATRGDD